VTRAHWPADESEPILELTSGTLLRDVAARVPDREALVAGQQRWTFHAVPQGEEPGVETWENDSWQYAGNTNVWTVMSCDEQLGYVYLPFSTPSNDYYGGQRLGNNLFAESLVALQAETGACGGLRMIAPVVTPSWATN